MLPRSPVLRRFALTQFLLECQFWFPVWILFLDHRGFDLPTMVLADAVFRFSMVALELPMGMLGDRLGRKRTYLLIAATAALTYLGIGLVQGKPMLFSVWILWGAYWALSSGASSAYLYELIRQEEREQRLLPLYGFFRAVIHAACLFSHLAAGFLFEIHPALPFAVSGGFALAALAIGLTLPEITEAEARRPIQTSAQAAREVWRRARRHPAVGGGCVLLALLLLYFWSPRILMQPLFLELGLRAGTVSAVFFAYSLAGVLSGLSAHRFAAGMGERPSIWLGFALLWTGILLAGVLPGHWALGSFPLVSFGYFLSQTVAEVQLHRELEDRHRASILSAASFLGGAFILLARPGLGLLASAENPRTAFLAWAGIGIPLAAGIALAMQRIRPASGN